MTNVELLVENVKRSKADIDEVYNKGYSDGKAEGGGDYSSDLIRKFVERNNGNNRFKEFTIPYGTTQIGHSAFRGCKELTTLNIPDTVTIIDNTALSMCYKLITELPDGVTIIGDSAFNSNQHQIITRLPLELKTIGKVAFQYCGAPFTLSEIPSKVETIGAQAFHNCTGFTELTFKGTPSSIATNSFQGCTNLLNIYVPWAEGEVANAPWGATNATIHYNSEV